jgi:hypothetical protein
MDADGDFVIAYQRGGIYARRYNSAGVAQGAEFRVNTYTTSSVQLASAAMDAEGSFIVVWTSSGQDGSGSSIHAQRYHSSGVAQGGEFRVNTYTTGQQYEGTVAMDAAGDFVVTWQSENGQDGSFDGVYAQRYAVVPSVTASAFLFATAPHRLRFSFDHDASPGLGSDDLVVQNLTTGQTIPSSEFTVAYDTSNNVATFTYAAAGGVLPEGNYRATLLAAGTTLPADHVFTFHFLRGDANHDGRVNLQDFNLLAANFGQSPRDFTQGDFDYDSVVNLSDFNILAARFGQVLAGPAAGASASDGSRRRDAWFDELLA